MACDYHLLPHPGIQTLAPYIPGKSTEELQEEQGLTDIIKLASNENQLGCSPLALQALQSLTPSQLAAYPQSASHPLRKKLATHFDLDWDMITLGNGTDMLFTLLQICFALHSDKHILTHEHAFISYHIQAKTLGIPVISTPLLPNWQPDIDAMIAACHEKTALIFIANPNNPTGSFLDKVAIKRLLENIPETTIVVLDEAYYEFIDEQDTLNSISLLNSHPNLVITRTFSKAYGLAGLRIGYAIANTCITALLHRVQLPFTVNKAALEAASAALNDSGFVKKTIENNLAGLAQLKQGFEALQLHYLPTFANFITFDCKMDSTPLYQALLRHGIIVRPLHPYGLTHFLRVTVGLPQQNSRFLGSLKEFYDEK